MLAFPTMLLSAAERAGIDTPKNADEYDSKEYPHFHVFCVVQLCRPMQAGEHWENAKVIASLSKEQVMNVTLADLLERGLHYQQ